MPTTTVQARDIKGLTPAVNAVNSDGTFVLSGKNYVFDSRGPKSAFGSLLVNDNLVQAPNGFQVVQVLGGHFVCTNEVIARINPVNFQLEPVLVFEPFQKVGRWTTGFLNGVQYFCHPGIGVLYWNQRNGQRGLLDVPGLPGAPIAIVVDNGRLVVLDEFSLVWSASSDGGNFNPQIGGPGAQLVSDRVSGTPVMVTSYGRGVFTWTTAGVMRSEFSGGSEVYRHRGINTEYSPVNSFCVVKLDDETSVILDSRGLFSSRGEPPVPFTAVFNEFLIEELKKNDSLKENNLRLEWDPFSRRIYISRSFTLTGELYDHAFVLYAPLEKWGDFSSKHYGFGHGFWLGDDQRLRVFGGTPHHQTPSVDKGGYSFDARRLYPELAQRQRQTKSLSSTIRLAGLPESQNSSFNVPGLYVFDGSALASKNRVGLDAKLVVGHFRLQQGFAGDEMSQVNELIIGSVESRALSTSDVDYNIVPDGVSDADYNVGTGSADFGLNPLTFVNFDLTMRGSIDGVSTFDVKQPAMNRFSQAMRYYSGGTAGIWHQVEMVAASAGDFFHVQSLQLNAVPAGRLL